MIYLCIYKKKIDNRGNPKGFLGPNTIYIYLYSTTQMLYIKITFIKLK